MTNDAKVVAVRETIEALINAGTTADLSALDLIYHDSMQTYMIDTDNTLLQNDKPAFIAMMKSMVEQSGGKPNKWAEFNLVTAGDNHGHVLITRKVAFGDDDRILVLSIDLVFEDDRWQVTREVIFNRPNPEPTPV